MTSATASRPVLAVTLGDVAGIGPEITAKTLLKHPDLREKCVPVVVGDADAMRAGATHAGLNPDAVCVITDPRAARNDPRTIELIQAGDSLGTSRSVSSAPPPETARTASSSRRAAWRATVTSMESSPRR